MRGERRVGVITGALLVTATVANLVATAIEQPFLERAGDLATVSGEMTRIPQGVLLEFLAAGTSAAIAVALYPLLRKWDAGLAIGSVVFRTIEAVMYAIGAVALLVISQEAQLFAGSPAAERTVHQAIAELLLAVRQDAILAGVFAFSAGALMYYVVFYRSGLVPRWLSGWGIAGVFLILLACLLALFSGGPVQTYVPLIVPLAAQEIVLAVWLIVKGFSAPASALVRSDARAASV